MLYVLRRCFAGTERSVAAQDVARCDAAFSLLAFAARRVAYFSFVSPGAVGGTGAAALRSRRVTWVCHPLLLGPRCRGVNSARAVSLTEMPGKKLVLLSMVAVVAPSGRLAMVPVPPRLSASAMMA